MADNDWKKRLGVVFSTNPDFTYEEEAADEPATIEPSKQNLIVSIDSQGRNYFEEKKKIYNKIKDEQEELISKQVGFIK